MCVEPGLGVLVPSLGLLLDGAGDVTRAGIMLVACHVLGEGPR